MENTEKNKNVYTIESVFCGTEPANEIYKKAIKKTLEEDYD
jgi:hypothetical protein